MSVSERRVLFEKCDENINHIYNDLWCEKLPHITIELLRKFQLGIDSGNYYYIYQESNLLSRKFINENTIFDPLDDFFMFVWKLFHLKFRTPKVKIFRVMILSEETINIITQKIVKNLPYNCSVLNYNNLSLSTKGSWVRNIDMLDYGSYVYKNFISGLFLSSDNVNVSNLKECLIHRLKEHRRIETDLKAPFDNEYSMVSINKIPCLKIDADNFGIEDNYYIKLRTTELIETKSFMQRHNKFILRRFMNVLTKNKNLRC